MRVPLCTHVFETCNKSALYSMSSFCHEISCFILVRLQNFNRAKPSWSVPGVPAVSVIKLKKKEAWNHSSTLSCYARTSKLNFLLIACTVFTKLGHHSFHSARELRQGPALDGRSSPVFAKRFWREINNFKHSFGDIFSYIWSSKKNLCDMQQRIVSRVIGNLVKRPAVEVPHLRAR